MHNKTKLLIFASLLLAACSDGALAEVDKPDRDRLRAAIYRCSVMGVATV